MRWQDSVVMVTGASSGIGAELARQAAARGGRVGLVARNEAALARLSAELGDRCVVAAADVTRRDEVEAAVKQVLATLGPIDIAVNNAGVGLYGAFLDTDHSDIERIMRTNYLGVVNVLQAVLPSMVERRRGHIVTIGSISGRIGSPFEAAYSASKFAVAGLTEALSVELAPLGIGVSLVNPGPVETAFFATRGHPYERTRPKPVTPAKVARTVIAAVERRRGETYVSRLLAQAVVSKTLLPPLFRWGTARAFADKLAEQASRPRGG